MTHPAHSPRCRAALRTLALAVLAAQMLVFTASAQGESASAEAAAVGEARVKLDEIIQQTRDADASASKASGDDAAALQRQAAEGRLAAMAQLRIAVDAVLAAEAASANVAADKADLAKLLVAIAPSLELRIEETQATLQAIAAERDAAPPENLIAIQQRLTRESDLLAQLTDAGIDYLDMLEAFGLDSANPRAYLQQQVRARAELIAGRIDLLATEVPAAQARAATTPDDAALAATIASLEARLDASTSALAASIRHLDGLGLDATRYKQVLIEATGEITADVFDRRVARGLIERWAGGIRESIAEDGPRVLFRTIVVVLILGLFWVGSRLVRRVVARAMEAPNLRFSALLKRMIVSLSTGLVLVLGVLVALSQLGVQVGPVLAGLGIAGFILGFALQETLANFAAGIMILAYRPYDVGDLIEVAGTVFGRVSHMNLVQTTILTLDNQTRMVPNGKIWGDVITNLTAQKLRRVDLVFGIHYQDDIPHAEEILCSIIEKHPKVVDDPEPMVRVHELGDSSVNFIVRPWTDPEDYWDVWWDVTREVKLRFDAEGITIPFPQQDVHFFHETTNGSGTAALPPKQSSQTDETAHDAPGEAD